MMLNRCAICFFYCTFITSLASQYIQLFCVSKFKKLVFIARNLLREKQFYNGLFFQFDFWKRFLKNQVGKIKFDKLPISNWIFTACVACKNQIQNWFLEVKNSVRRTWFFKLDFSNLIFQKSSTDGESESSCIAALRI